MSTSRGRTGVGFACALAALALAAALAPTPVGAEAAATPAPVGADAAATQAPAAADAGATPAAGAAPVTVSDYTDPGEAILWTERSHWKQPWRSYLTTVPASTLLDAIGINFNVKPREAAATARLLGGAGFRRARIEVGWASIDYADGDRLTGIARRNLVASLTALHEAGIRPLILLNANDGLPCPAKNTSVHLTSPAPAGARKVHVVAADLGAIVPGKTGVSFDGTAADTLFTGVAADGTVTLSKPLSSALPAGELKVVTLRYEPFRPATLADGEVNPGNAETLRGWLDYVRVVTREVKAILGSDEFDVEVWNELSFGSRFLNINSYYDPKIEWEKNGNFYLILDQTARLIRDPASGLPDVGVGNGFANESPFWSGSNEPLGVTAIDKHPYAGWQAFPEDAWSDEWTPEYDAFFPELYLSGIATETMVRDLSPYPSRIGNTTHGRYTHPEGGAPPQLWMTEVNLAPGSGPTPRRSMSAAEIRHIESKEILRYLVAYVNKGVTAVDFFAAQAGDVSLVDPAFFSAVKADPDAYPGDAAGGETIDAVRRLAAAMGGGPISRPRSLSLRGLTDFAGNVQFEGDPSGAHPPLYNRDVFAFLPFQASDNRFVVPVYVMTRNVAKVYNQSAPGTSRFEMPPETYRLAIGGVDGETATVSATDPLQGASVPVEVVGREAGEVEVELPVTDSPRLLAIEDQGFDGSQEEEGTLLPPGEAGEEGDMAADPAVSEEVEAADAPAGNGKPRRPKPAAEAPPLDPHLRAKGQAALLQRRRMTVLARCEERCQLTLRGRLVVAGRRYPVAVAPGGGPLEAGGPAPLALRLSIPPGTARRALTARSRGTGVKLLLAAEADPVGAGGAEAARLVIRLGR